MKMDIKRFVSLLLVFLMLAGVMPLQTLADDVVEDDTRADADT